MSTWGIARSSAYFGDFFFMLSGFVIAYAYRERLTNALGVQVAGRPRLRAPGEAP